MLRVLEQREVAALVMLEQVCQILEPRLHDEVEKALEARVRQHQPSVKGSPDLWPVLRE